MKNNKTKEQNPRLLALSTLHGAERDGRYINLAADVSIKGAAMEECDVALFTTLVYGVTEKKITLDYIISKMASKGGSHIEPRVRNILRMGLYQLIYMDKIPSHAAVNETVALCKNRGECSFVNAILRNYIRDGERRVVFPKKEDGIIPYLSIRYSFPEWICASLCRDYGEENAEGILSRFCSSSSSMTIHVNTLKTCMEDVIKKLSEKSIPHHLCAYAPNAIKLPEGAKITSLCGFDTGEFFVQDEASQISAHVLMPKENSVVIDTCTCPGSKSFAASLYMNNKGKIYSFDLHENKLSLVLSSAKRLGIDIIETAKRDGRMPDTSLFGMADHVICDVPCSGLGVMAKKPDIRYKNEEDILPLAPLGLELLTKSANYLKVGGTLIFSTCTLRRAENEDTVMSFLKENKNFTLTPFTLKSRSDTEPDIVSDGMLTLLPHIHKTDGFFIAKLTKIS